MPRRRPDWAALGARLDVLAATFGLEHLTPDPLEVVRGFAAPDDVEVAGFLCAGLAFGSARVAKRSAADLLARIAAPRASGAASGGLAAAVRDWDDALDAPRLRGWRHRWLGEREAAAVVHVLARVLREHGSIEAFFAAGDPGAGGVQGPRAAADRAPDICPALTSFCDRALALAPPGAPPRLAYWFAGPAKGGSAKRLCLYLRWMCRRDAVDPGPWTSVDPARLVMPLDVHVARIGRYCGLLRRRSANWRAAQEVTANLRRFGAADPVRFDHAICRLGVLGTCPKRRQARKCDACPLYEVCLL